MRLSSLLGCRRRTSRPAGLVGGSHRPELYRPRLELLEDRLPPGDMLPGGLLGSPLWGPSSSAVDPDPWTPEGTSAGSLPASLRGTGRSQWTVMVSGRLAAEPVLAAADHSHVQPQHEGGETAPLLAGGSGVGSKSRQSLSRMGLVTPRRVRRATSKRKARMAGKGRTSLTVLVKRS